jgi:hypothetical protein
MTTVGVTVGRLRQLLWIALRDPVNVVPWLMGRIRGARE